MKRDLELGAASPGAGGPSCLTIHSGAEVRSLRAGLRVARWGWGGVTEVQHPSSAPQGVARDQGTCQGSGPVVAGSIGAGGFVTAGPYSPEPRSLEET